MSLGLQSDPATIKVIRTIEGLAEALLTRLQADLAHHHTASLTLPGGGTPKPLFVALATHPQTRTVDWTKVTVVPNDERRLPLHDAHSNLGALRKAWQGTPLADARTLDLWNTADRAQLSTLGTFTATVVGMGLDGHTASLFPDNASPSATDPTHTAPVCEVDPIGSPPVARASLSLHRLLHTRWLVVLTAGADKADAFHHKRQNPLMPIARLLTHAHAASIPTVHADITPTTPA